MAGDVEKIIAFDFASSGIKAMAAEVLKDNFVRIKSVEKRVVDGIKTGIIEQPSGIAFNIGVLYKELINSSGFKSSNPKFSTSFGGKNMKIVEASAEKRLNRQKAISEDILNELAAECEKSFKQENMTVYDTIPVIYEVDHKEMEKPEGMKGNYIHGSYYLVVGSSQMKLQFNKCMERIGNYNVEYMPLSAEAFSIAVTEEEERIDGCAVINFGGTSTTLAVYKGEILEDLMVVPFGGKHISRDLEEYGISESLAEKLKCTRGFAAEKYVDKPVNIKIPALKPGAEPVVVTNLVVSMIIEARLEEILSPILKVIRNYKGELKHGLIITGGGASLQGLNEYLEEKTGLPSRLGDHSGWLTSDTATEYQKPEYSQLIGTILLTHDYRQESKKPVTNDASGTKKKSPRRSIGDAITQGIFRFFEEDTELQEPDEKTGKGNE